jgi:hypothetical protein
MTDESPPLRGDAAWRAQKAEIAKRNDAARAGGAARRAEQDEKSAQRRYEEDRRERTDLPEQPRP